MANLETLELTINANAESASKGLTELINSLSSLSKGIGKSISGLKALNAELEKLKKYGGLKLPDLSKAVSSTKAVSEAKKTVRAVKKASEEIDEAMMGNRGAVNRASPTYNEEEYQAAYRAKMEANRAEREAFRQKTQRWRIQQALNQAKAIGDQVKMAAEDAAVPDVPSEKMGNGLENFKTGLKNLGKELKGLIPKLSAFHKVLRIASTMLIRMGIKALFKGIKEGMQNYYQYSKSNGLGFAQQMDQLASTWSQLKNQMGAALTPAISAAIPVINALANAAITAFNALSQLLALLSGKSSWSKATAQVEEFGEATKEAGSGGGGMKELLAAFDELNVIASESGGGGGSGNVAEEYSDMFEEIYEFDERLKAIADTIRDVVGWVRDNFDYILEVIGLIGAAILGWKISKAFADSLGWLSKLGGLLATGAVIAITVLTTWKFTNEYLETGNIGWLLADALATALGTTAAWYIAKQLLGSNAAAWAAAITLTFSAIAGIVALLGHTDVGALSLESILVAIENALKLGAAGAILLKSVGGASMKTALTGGAGIAIASFGVIIGLKAILDPNIDTFDTEHIKSIIISSMAVGLGLKLLTGSWVIAGGAALLAFSAVVGLKAVLDEHIDPLSKLHITIALISALSAGLGLKLISGSWAIAGGTALMVFGAVIGLKTALDPHVDYDDVDFLKSTVTSALLMGLGTWIAFGNPLAAGCAALATAAVLIAIKVSTTDKAGVDWGDVELSLEEIHKYVEDKLGFDVYLEIKLANAKLTNVKAAKEHLDELIYDFSTSLMKIKLNVDASPEAIEGAKGQIDNIIDQLKTYLKETSDLTGYLFNTLPYDNDTKSGVLSDLSGADSEIIRYVEGEAQKIANAYDEGMKSGWKNNEQEEILALMEHLEAVINGANDGIDYNKLMAASKIGLTGFTKETAQEIIKAQKEAFSEYEKGVGESVQASVESLLYRAQLAENAGMPEVAAKLRADADMIINTFQEEMDKKLSPAKEELKSEWLAALTEIYSSEYTTAVTDHIGLGFQKELKERLAKDEESAKELIRETLERATQVNAVTKDATELFDITGWELLGNKGKEKFVASIYQSIGMEGVSLLKQTLNIPAFDLITITDWKSFSNEERLNFINAIAESYGSEEAIRAAKAAGIDVANEINEGLSSQGEGARTAANSLVSQIRGVLSRSNVEVPVNATVDVLVNATVNVTSNGNVSTTAVSAATRSGIRTYTDMMKASGAYGIPSGDVFIANEQGAELVGTINGKTSVANQEQIIEGIQRGVSEANAEQNELLRQQNGLLMKILQKESSFKLGPSMALGRVVNESMNMYETAAGGR